MDTTRGETKKVHLASAHMEGNAEKCFFGLPFPLGRSVGGAVGRWRGREETQTICGLLFSHNENDIPCYPSSFLRSACAKITSKVSEKIHQRIALHYRILFHFFTFYTSPVWCSINNSRFVLRGASVPRATAFVSGWVSTLQLGFLSCVGFFRGRMCGSSAFFLLCPNYQCPVKGEQTRNPTGQSIDCTCLLLWLIV